MKLAARAGRLPVETAFEQAEKLCRAGIPFINFAHGDPDQPTSEAVKAATCLALARNETRYSDTLGLTALRQAVAEHVGRTRGVPVSREEVIVLPGANPAVFLGLLLVIDEGDEVIYPNPGYPLYPSAVKAAGGEPVPLPLRPELGYTFDPRELTALITPRTRAVIINSPNNPTGSVLGPEHLAALAEAAAGRDLWLLSDEVYADFVYEGRFESVFSRPEARGRVLLIDSFSKTFAMTGWRLGYAVGPRPLIERLGTLFALVDFSVNTFIQHGGIEALRRHDEIAACMRALYRERRDRIVAGLNAVPGVVCPVPAGSFYVFPEVTEACRRLGLQGAKALQKLVLEKCRVALLARDWFGPRNPGETGERVRLTYTLPLADIEEGLRRLKSLVERK
ncbi:MAG: aminotransferase class I/II-fold pyridoxal phosphate-dependent enzyme [Thermoanaerobacterales bacterium]|nr:aminotransferase class I/II-fold pyridoxal phosphate-dependent enzyme [Bacillota bacterium]MDI6907208.1 aminotransferase class I/II-fold pyridoxal phosphate-dependent enzyme [Thermoanaerobacterales bacterium]